MPPPLAQPRRRAFTLLELIAVMILIAITLAVAAPSLRGFGDARQADDAATQMLVLIRWAQQRAVLEARAYRFNVDPAQGRYFLTAQEGAAFVAVAEDMGRPFALPPGASVTWIEPPRGAAAGAITVDPTGTVEPATLRITSRLGVSYELACASAAEPFRVVRAREVEP